MKPLKTFAALAVPFIVIIGCSAARQDPAPAGPDALSHLVTTVQPAVVTIQTFDENMASTGIGTGFFIDSDGSLITNYHVIDGAFAASVKTAEGDSYPVAAVLAENQSVDLVKVSVDIPAEAVRWIAVTGDVPDIAERIVVVGTPLGLEQTVSEGIVSAIRELPGFGNIFQMTAPIARGSSGSPVVNLAGEVIGVVSFQSLVGQNINFAVAGQGVIDLVNTKSPVALGEWTYRKTLEKPELVKSLCRSGHQFSIRGQYKEALVFFREATEQQPDDSEAWYGLGHCYVGLERNADAIDAYKEVIRTDPENPFSHYNLGRFYLELGEFQKAVDVFDTAVGVDPDYIPAIFEKAVALGRLGKTDDELTAYEAIIRINPRFYPAHHLAGLLHYRMGRYSEAMDAQKRALSINPDFVPAHLALGLIWHKLEDTDKAREAYQEALRIDPDFPKSHYQMGLLYVDTGDRAAALQEYKVLKNLDTDMAERLFRQIYP